MVKISDFLSIFCNWYEFSSILSLKINNDLKNFTERFEIFMTHRYAYDRHDFISENQIQ